LKADLVGVLGSRSAIDRLTGGGIMSKHTIKVVFVVLTVSLLAVRSAR
jgi:hypothetical protein